MRDDIERKRLPARASELASQLSQPADAASQPDSAPSESRESIAARARRIENDLTALRRELKAFRAELDDNSVQRLRQAIDQLETAADELNSTDDNRQPSENAARLDDAGLEIERVASRVGSVPAAKGEASAETDGGETPAETGSPSETLMAASRELREQADRLSRGDQNAPPSNATVAKATRGIQVAGRSLRVELERILQAMNYEALPEEVLPPEYDAPVARYFEALSVDK